MEGQAPNTPQVNALGAGQWTSGPVTFTLSGAQATSGIQKYQYSTDGGKTWQDVAATASEEATAQNPVNVLEARLTVSENAATAQGVSYQFRAVSNAGNASQATQSYVALIDQTAPSIEMCIRDRDENGDSQTLTDNWTAVTADLLTWTKGWYVATGEVTIGSRVTVTGDVKLILADGASLTVNGGISVEKGNSFTIYAQSTGDAMGTLTAQNLSLIHI